MSVIVPVRNAAPTIDAQLDALASQTYHGDWELVVADNGSTDGSRERVTARLAEFPAVRVVDAPSRPGAGHARNEGVRVAIGDLLLFCDADDVVSPGWLSALVEAAGEADLVTGPLEHELLNDAVSRSWQFIPPRNGPFRAHDFLFNACGGNCAVWRDVFAALGGFDEERLTCEDIDFAWRAQLASYRLGYAPDGVVHHRLRCGLADLARQRFRWGQGHAQLFREHRSNGMPRARFWEVVRAWGWIVLCAPVLAPSRTGRGRWVIKAADRTGRMAGSLAERVLFL